MHLMEIALGESYLPHTLQGNSPSLAIGRVVLPMPVSNLGVAESVDDVAVVAFGLVLQLLPF